MTDRIHITEESGILRVAINWPEKKNALSEEMYEALTEAIERTDREDSLRVLLLESHAEGMFTAGNEMSSFLSPAPRSAEKKNASWRLMEAAARAEKPLIAAVNGPAIGIGATLMMHFDFVYAVPDAYFLMPFTRIGIVPEAGASLLVPRYYGRQAAAEFMLAADTISAERGYDMGFVNRVVAPEDLLPTALATAETLMSRAPEALRLTKKLIKGDTDELIERIDLEMRTLGTTLQGGEVKEAVTAFMQKRKPDFSKAG